MKTPSTVTLRLRIASVLLAPALVAGCGSADTRNAMSDSFADEMPEDLPAGRCGETEASSTGSDAECDTEAGPVEETTTGASSSGGVPEDDCQSGEECLGDSICAAGWDAETAERLPFTCEFACIELVDEERYCADDGACCDAAAVCTPRGYCVLPG